MAYFKFEEKNIYYEIHGEGKPLIMLNGIMMSTLSWTPYLEELTKKRKVILIDFVDQGKSYSENKDYTHVLQVEVVRELVTYLELDSFDLFGISYGGQIALQYAIEYDVDRLLVFNGSLYTSPWLTDIGRAWSMAAKTYDPKLFFNVSIPYVYSHTFYNENIEWINNRKEVLYKVFNKEFLDRMIRLIESSESYDIREKVKKITATTLVVASTLDYITPLDETKNISKSINSSEFIVIDCGHASMYEKPEEFLRIIQKFLL